MRKIATLATLIAVVGMASVANALIKDTDIYNIRTHSGGIAENDSVRVTNVALTGIDINPTTYGFWAQELTGGPYSGILIYTGSLYPTGLRRGHLVRATGKYVENPAGGWPASSCSEIKSYYSWQLDTLGTTDVPAPLLFSCSQLGYWPADSARAEKWEGTLVKLDTVVVVNGVGSDPRKYVIKEAHNHAGAGPWDTILVRNDKMDPSAPVRPADGDTLVSITGDWYYEYGQYRLCPRDSQDIVELTKGVTVTATPPPIRCGDPSCDRYVRCPPCFHLGSKPDPDEKFGDKDVNKDGKRDFFMGQWKFDLGNKDLIVQKWCINKDKLPNGEFGDYFSYQILTSEKGHDDIVAIAAGIPT